MLYRVFQQKGNVLYSRVKFFRIHPNSKAMVKMLKKLQNHSHLNLVSLAVFSGLRKLPYSSTSGCTNKTYIFQYCIFKCCTCLIVVHFTGVDGCVIHLVERRPPTQRTHPGMNIFTVFLFTIFLFFVFLLHIYSALYAV